ncbi:hypothetical protein FQR65_LT08348 [Abscondita terminalis]|nr:hypothetical protein FQR65_LT08348 [Abscondita terminalis]
MYDLAPRFGKTYSATTKDVGPNTYITCCEKDQYPHWAPFLTGAKRKTDLSAPTYTEALYHPEQRRKIKIKGGASIIYTAKRSKPNKNNTPGPANYDAKPREKGCKCSPPLHGKGRLYLCRVPFTNTISAPSVPTRIDQNGYNVDQFGNTVKNPATVYDISRGPAYYNIPRKDLNITTRLYHQGSQWSKSNVVRFKKQKSDTPGVGEYNLNLKSCLDPSLVEYRGLARLFSFLPRFTEGEMLKATRNNFPAPNSYNINTSSFERKEPVSVVPVPFVSREPRFKYTATDIPGPAHYKINDNKKEFLCKEVPFCVGSDRWKSSKLDTTPGPNAYKIVGGITEKLKNKPNRYSIRDVPFLNTAKRMTDFVHNGEFPTPWDNGIEISEVPKLPIYSSCFKSRSRRFQNSLSEEAGPGSYNVGESFNKNTNRKSHNTGKVPFLTSTLRLKDDSKILSPGPADYLKLDNMVLKGLTIPSVPRFKELPDETPGPGTYKIHPSIADSVYKGIGTHNLRLRENVMRTKLRLPPGATWARWHDQLQRKKKLRWFARPMSEYTHCITAS